MALAGDQQIFAVVDEDERGEIFDQGAIEVLLERPVEGFALTGCDARVDTRRVHIAAASLAAAEMSNDTRCIAPSSA